MTTNEPTEDLIRELIPHKRQKDFLSLPDDIFEALYGGAAYGGKTFLLVLLPLFRGFYKYRGFRGIIFRRTFSDLEKEIIRLSRDYYPITGGKYNEQKHSWHWPEYGSYIDFGHVNHASDIRQYDSSQYNYAAFDELTHFEEAPYIYFIGSRVRPSSSFNVSIVRNGTNPGGVGQTFTYNRFVKPCEDGYKLLKDKKTGLSRIFIPAFYTDNPYGLEYDPRYGDKLEILPDAEKRAKKYGDWHAFEGSVFPEFRPLKFPNEPDNAIHVIEPFEIPEWWPKILSIDWGKRAMCHAMWGAISPSGRTYIYRERAWKNVDVPYWAAEIKDYSHKENIVYCILCGSAWQERGTETIAIQFERYSGIRPYSSDNSPGSRIAGIQLIHDFLRWTPKKNLLAEGELFDLDKSQWILRNFGAEAQIKYQSQFIDEEPERDLPKLQIFNTCPILIETIPVAIYDEKRPEDIAEFDGDDPLDNLRYFCKAINTYNQGLDREMEQRRTRQEIVDKYAMTGDVTRFYRQMEYHDAMNKTPMTIRRRRRA